eukprot:4126808-Amphidinium_carterae.1
MTTTSMCSAMNEALLLAHMERQTTKPQLQQGLECNQKNHRNCRNDAHVGVNETVKGTNPNQDIGGTPNKVTTEYFHKIK